LPVIGLARGCTTGVCASHREEKKFGGEFLAGPGRLESGSGEKGQLFEERKCTPEKILATLMLPVFYFYHFL